MSRTVLGAACVIALAAGGLTLGACSSDPVVLTLTVPDGPVTPDGKTAAKIEIRVTKGGEVVNTGSLSLTSSLVGTQFDAPIEMEDSAQMPGSDSRKFDTEVSAGSATVDLYSVAKGKAKVIVNFTDETTGAVASETKEIVFDSGSATIVGGITFVEAVPASLQLRGSGGNTTSQVTFKVVDTTQAPARGVAIEFELGSTLGGASLDPVRSTTGDTGLVTTTLTAGTVPGSITVRAFTTDRAISGESGTITIALSVANYKNLDFVCAKPAIGGFAFDLLEMGCTAAVADRNGQKLPNVKVIFKTEAGSINAEAMTDETGNATVTHKTQNPDPLDVEPNIAYLPPSLNPGSLSQEPSQQCACRANPSQLCTCNPRDGLVTLIAVTSGEEQFTDSNGNGTWDEGENFVDLSEPFIDMNDNGRFDRGSEEDDANYYVDTNGNGQWDDKNFQWDANTQIWRATKLVWTDRLDESASGFYDPNTGAPQSRVSVPHGGYVETTFLVVDQYFNRLVAHAGDAISCTCASGGCTVFPDQIGLGDSGGGKRYERIKVKDSHLSSDETAAWNDDVSCTAAFSQDADNNATIDVSGSLSASGT